jgi:hypothetical protein
MHRRGKQAAAVRVLRRIDHLLDRRQLDDLAGIHDADAIGHLDRHADVVGDEDHAEVELALQLPDQEKNLDLHGRVERRGRLVGQ